MLGAASEKAILILIEAYTNSIKLDANRERFSQRTNGKMISKKYEEFKSSYAGCKNKPTDQVITQDLTHLLDNAFNYYRFSRNKVGHPQIIPDLDKGVILANLGQFITYAERIYALKQYFENNGVEL